MGRPLPWFKVDSDFMDEIRFWRLRRALKLEELTCAGLLTSFWSFAARSIPEGRINGTDPDLIAAKCHWMGPSQDLINALTEAGYVKPETGEIIDWEGQPMIQKRSRNKQHYNQKCSASETGLSEPEKATTGAESDKKGVVNDNSDAKTQLSESENGDQIAGTEKPDSAPEKCVSVSENETGRKSSGSETDHSASEKAVSAPEKIPPLEPPLRERERFSPLTPQGALGSGKLALRFNKEHFALRDTDDRFIVGLRTDFGLETDEQVYAALEYMHTCMEKGTIPRPMDRCRPHFTIRKWFPDALQKGREEWKIKHDREMSERAEELRKAEDERREAEEKALIETTWESLSAKEQASVMKNAEKQAKEIGAAKLKHFPAIVEGFRRAIVLEMAQKEKTEA